VWPSSISTLPSALGMKSGVILMGRRSCGARPSVRNLKIPFCSCFILPA
jgi:hypothetical protein